MTCDRNIDCKHQSIDASFFRAINECHARIAVFPHIELKPVMTIRRGSNDIFNCCCSKS